MGDLRNIRRTFCFGRALGKFNKKSPLKVIPSNVFILYALSEQGRAVTVQELQEYLKRNKHHYSTTIIKESLAKFTQEGWLSLTNPYPARYAITLEGRNTLGELERRIRNERSDK